MLTSVKANPAETAAKSAPPAPEGAGRPVPIYRGPVTEQGVAAAADPRREGHRVILYERLTGEEARQRAASPEPHGAGMLPEAVDKVEYVEVWGTQNPADGCDLRMYSFGGALITSRSTRE